MRLCVFGSRTLYEPECIAAALASLGWQPTEWVSGTASGADRAGEEVARRHGIPLKRFPAEWRKGRWAGYERNQVMLDHVAEALPNARALAHWDGLSRGTRHSIGLCRELGIPVAVLLSAGGHHLLIDPEQDPQRYVRLLQVFCEQAGLEPYPLMTALGIRVRAVEVNV